MTLQPFEHYAAQATADTNKRWEKSLKFFVIGGGALGVIIGWAMAPDDIMPRLIGAVVGAVIGYAIFRGVVYSTASGNANSLYRLDWCEARGMTYLSGDHFPPDAPHAKDGYKRNASDTYQGVWNNLETLFYNFRYTTKGSNDNPDVNHDFQIMRLTGRELPIARLTIHQRSALNKFAWADKLQGAFTPERPVSLESVDFNNKFDLTIDDKADDIWIRRIFDPATIQELVDGHFTIPDLTYYNRAWWFVWDGHFATRDLEDWVERQSIAASAVEKLSRIQTL